MTVPLLVRLGETQCSVRHETVRNDLGVLIREWFAKKKELRVIRGALTDLLTVDGLTPEAVFTRIVQTMEHFHGVISEEKGLYVAKCTWRNFCTWLDGAYPGDLGVDDSEELEKLKNHHELFIERIKGVNSLSFRSRLNELFDRVPRSVLMPVLDNPDNINDYVFKFLKKLDLHEIT